MHRIYNQIKSSNYVITTTDNNSTDVCNSYANASDGSIHRLCDEEHIVFVDSSGKLVSTTWEADIDKRTNF